jgi:insertion element IS1 protein InsB
VFQQLQSYYNPLYTDHWGSLSPYHRHLSADQYAVGKKNTQKIECKNLNLRTWIKRLTRKTICFSKSEIMHDTVIGLLINKVEFGVDIYDKSLV